MLVNQNLPIRDEINLLMEYKSKIAKALRAKHICKAKSILERVLHPDFIDCDLYKVNGYYVHITAVIDETNEFITSSVDVEIQGYEPLNGDCSLVLRGDFAYSKDSVQNLAKRVIEKLMFTENPISY